MKKKTRLIKKKRLQMALRKMIKRASPEYKASSKASAKIVMKYPFLLISVRADYFDDSVSTWLDCIPSGWRKAFADYLCEDLTSELTKLGYLDRYKIDEVKEKYGQLRWYDNVSLKTDFEYSHISEMVCIMCGNPYARMTELGRWFEPLCEDCFLSHNFGTKEDFEKFPEWTDCKYVSRRYSPEGYSDTEHDFTDKMKKIRTRWEAGECSTI